MKKICMILGFLALSFAPLAANTWCVADSTCGMSAAVIVPPGGTCQTSSDDFIVFAISFDANGDFYQVDRAQCPIGPC